MLRGLWPHALSGMYREFTLNGLRPTPFFIHILAPALLTSCRMQARTHGSAEGWVTRKDERSNMNHLGRVVVRKWHIAWRLCAYATLPLTKHLRVSHDGLFVVYLLGRHGLERLGTEKATRLSGQAARTIQTNI